MKVLVVGAEGFVGRAVADWLATEHEVVRASRRPVTNGVQLDLLDPASIEQVLRTVSPEVIINCAGIIKDGDVSQNSLFTTNLLQAVVATQLQPKRIIICGSAAEYGTVSQLPVAETAPLNADSGYGLSKQQEVAQALDFAAQHKLPLVVVRIFNAIGPDMRPGFLISNLLQQIQEVRGGQRSQLEVNHLDSRRDYINVRDLAAAFAAIVNGKPKQQIYNAGSGVSTSNAELIELLLKNSKLTTRPEIVETASAPETHGASQADISRLQQEFGWQPQHTLETTIQEIMHVTG